MTEIIIRSLEDIRTASGEFLRESAGRKVIAFYGSMGAGKTTFIKAFCEVLGVTDIVNSPTFTIINEYAVKSGEPVYHFDLYRVEKIEDLYNIGFEEYLDSGFYCLVEWPEIAGDLLPKETLRVRIEEIESGARRLILNV